MATPMGSNLVSVAAVATVVCAVIAYWVLNASRSKDKKDSKEKGRDTTKRARPGRASLAGVEEKWCRPKQPESPSVDPATGRSPRLAAARRNCSDGQTFESIEREASELRKRGAFWQDLCFPHSDDSLFVDPACPPTDWLRSGERDKVLKNMRVEWQPPPRFSTARRPCGVNTKGEPTCLYADLDEAMGATSAQVARNADDVVQGSLGDCYFMSALALAPSDASVCDDLIDATFEDVGIYGVTLFVDGCWELVWVDCYFPCYVSNDTHGARPKPIYASARDHREIWPMVIEKVRATRPHGDR